MNKKNIVPFLIIENHIINLYQRKSVSIEKDKVVARELPGNVYTLSLDSADKSTIPISLSNGNTANILLSDVCSLATCAP